MGFFRFLSKGKGQSEDELDVPPLPPMGNEKGGLDSPFPSDELSSFGDMPQMSVSQAPSSQKAQSRPFDEFDLDSFAEMDDEPKKDILAPPLPSQRSAPLPTPSYSAPLEQKPAHHTQRTAFVRIDRVKQVLADLSDIRSDLRKADELLAQMGATAINREKDYLRYKNNLTDIQRKLVFMDKTLFKGGGQ